MEIEAVLSIEYDSEGQLWLPDKSNKITCK